MRPGELVVARLSRGASVVRLLEVADDRTTVAIGRNKQARIPHDRIALATGVIVAGEQEAEAFRREAEDLAATIDVAEVWDLVADGDPAPLTADDLAELYWGPGPSPARRAALVIHLHVSDDLFVYRIGAYAARSRTEVHQRLQKRARETQQAEEASSLLLALSEGRLPSPPTGHKESLLRLLQDYAVHGDELPRAGAARDLIAGAGGSADLQRRAFELLVAGGVYSPDEALEVHRAGVPTAFPRDAVAEAESIDLDSVLGSAPRKDLTTLHAVTIDDEHTLDRDDAISVEVDGEGVRVGVHISDAGALIPTGGAGGPRGRPADGDPLPPRRRHPDAAARSGEPDRQPRPGRDTTGPESAHDAIGVGRGPGLERHPLNRPERGGPLLPGRRPRPGGRWRPKAPIAGHPGTRRDGSTSQTTGSRRPGNRTRRAGRQRARIGPSRRFAAPVHAGDRAGKRAHGAVQLTAGPSSAAPSAIPAAFRSQPQPDIDDPRDAGSQDAPPPAPQLRRYLMMRRLRPADIDVQPAPHAGLGVRAYIQATSPLRRYPDLVMQRQVSHYLAAGSPLYSEEEIASVAQRAEVQIRELTAIEEERKRYWFLKYLRQSRLELPDSGDAALFKAVVLDSERGRSALLELADFPFRLRARLSSPGGAGRHRHVETAHRGPMATRRPVGARARIRGGNWATDLFPHRPPTSSPTGGRLRWGTS